MHWHKFVYELQGSLPPAVDVVPEEHENWLEFLE